MLAECMNKTVVEVDGAAALDGELANKGDKTISGGQTWFSSKWNYTGKKTVSATRMRMNTYLKQRAGRVRERLIESARRFYESACECWRWQDGAYSRRSRASVAEQMGRLARRTCREA